MTHCEGIRYAKGLAAKPREERGEKDKEGPENGPRREEIAMMPNGYDCFPHVLSTHGRRYLPSLCHAKYYVAPPLHMAGFHGIVSLRWIKSYVATFVMS
jgi:hypothetical protein